MRSMITMLMLSLVLSGCGIKVLGLKQKDASTDCPEGERVYFYRDAKVGICLKEQVVLFTHCVSELSLSKTDSDSTRSVTVDVQGIEKVIGSAKLTPEAKERLVREFAAGGELEKARAEAIRACVKFSGISKSTAR